MMDADWLESDVEVVAAVSTEEVGFGVEVSFVDEVESEV
jgi:hypothetical protein